MKKMNLEDTIDSILKEEDVLDSNENTSENIDGSHKNVVKKRKKTGKEIDKARLYIWICAILLIVVQVILLRWWTIITGPITIFIAILIEHLISKREMIKEQIRTWIHQNMSDSFVYAIAIIAIIVEILTIKWWTIIAGPATLFLAYLLNNLKKAVVKYFYHE